MTRTIANMATYPGRAIASVISTIESLVDQVDEINLCLNSYESVPAELLSDSRVKPFIPQSDYKDVGKFCGEFLDTDDIFLVDDDIIYPPDYVDTHKHYRSKFGEMDLVFGVHGVIYSDLFDGSVESRKVFSFPLGLDAPRVVNQLGTGTVYLKGYQMPSLEFMEGSQKYVDVRFARWQSERGRSLVCIPRSKGWLSEVAMESSSIFADFTTRWPIAVTIEAQGIAGYSKIACDALSYVEMGEILMEFE